MTSYTIHETTEGVMVRVGGVVIDIVDSIAVAAERVAGAERLAELDALPAL